MAKRHRVVWRPVLAVLAVAALTMPLGRLASAESAQRQEEAQNHALMLGFLKTILTAEVTEFTNTGSYATWPTLVAHQQDYLNGWLRHYPRGGSPQFGTSPEVLPGWKLRLNVHSDGQGFDVMVEDADAKDGYAAISDERLRIRVGRVVQ